jgi:polyphosphate kinase
MDKFFDRELSALEFNARVLAEGMDPTNPLLERLKFIGIVSSNMDEFFMVRIASLKASRTPMDMIRKKALALLETRNAYFLNTLVPELEAAGLKRLAPESCSPEQLEFLNNYFHKEFLPVLTPIAIAEDRPLPVLSNLRLYFCVGLQESGRKAPPKYAVVEIPSKAFPRMVFLPSEKGHPFVLAEDVIGAFASELFPGYEILEKGVMRLTRGAELSFDEEKDDDFARVITEALHERRTGEIVRMEISATSGWAEDFKKKLGISPEDVVVNPSWIDLKTISQLAFQTGFDQLKRPAWQPRAVPDFERAKDLWPLLKEKSVLVFHPYESFDAVIQFIETAAADPDVLAIKQTLYRTDQNSAVVRALERAAENGKRVTVLIELKARFDEESNVEWAKRLTKAGASVLYGIAGLKTHAKVCLVVRREREGIKRYVHTSTGNYNERTAMIYSDIGYFSSDDDLANDVSAFFNMITGYSQPITWSKIEVAPFGLRRRLLRMIRREALRSTPEHPGLIRAKMNSLVDTDLIEALYQASKAGVKIELNVRGICCLRPGVPHLSETIKVTSIVDQFLEHSRIFHFANGGEDEVYVSSADWMPRNLDRRVEMMIPIEDLPSKKMLMEALDTYFRDNAIAWMLEADGSYTKLDHGKTKKIRAQEAFCNRALSAEDILLKSMPKELKPQKPRPSPLSPPTS